MERTFREHLEHIQQVFMFPPDTFAANLIEHHIEKDWCDLDNLTTLDSVVDILGKVLNSSVYSGERLRARRWLECVDEIVDEFGFVNLVSARTFSRIITGDNGRFMLHAPDDHPLINIMKIFYKNPLAAIKFIDTSPNVTTAAIMDKYNHGWERVEGPIDLGRYEIYHLVFSNDKDASPFDGVHTATVSIKDNTQIITHSIDGRHAPHSREFTERLQNAALSCDLKTLTGLRSAYPKTTVVIQYVPCRNY